jgi:penicillin-binding protein 2
MLQLDRHTPSPGSAELVRRVGWGAGVIAVAFLILVGRLWQLQIVRGDQYHQRSTDNFVKERKLPAVRGLIKDRHGVVLVDNRPAFSIWVVPRRLGPEAKVRLYQLLGLTQDEREVVDARLDRASRKDTSASVLLLDDVSADRLELIAQAHGELPGVTVKDAPHREYPSGTVAAHVLGYMNLVTAAELESRPEDDYEDGDYVGRYGIEKEWENYLRGKKGFEKYVVDAKGRRKSDDEAAELIEGERYVPPIPGHNVILTLDVDLQRIVERAMRSRVAGGVAVVDVHTGKILALYSKPAFDPNVMTGRLSRDEEALMLADPLKPFIDKTLRQHYYPGSTYKFVTALTALDGGEVDEKEKLTCKGWYPVGRHQRPRRCSHVHGDVNCAEAMSQSCNIYYWQIAERVGMDRLAETAKDFGFGAPSGLGLNGDVPGRVPYRAWYEKMGGFRIGYTLNTSIGQGDTEVTVVQLVMAYAALANGGQLFVPQIVERVETAEGLLVKAYAPILRHVVKATAHALGVVQKGLWGTVNDPKGTAYETRMTQSTIVVAGKTGTAQVGEVANIPKGSMHGWDPRNHHAWFAGYAPADDPQIAFVVLVEHGGKGADAAAPVAMEIVRGYFEQIAPEARPTRMQVVPLPSVGGSAPAAPLGPEDPDAVDDPGLVPE